ncbi:major facilitator superfamily domain-containing protein [Camillea tinctor]|nr:major facilitator superfamily domain-containing protein [Camillea tinctor]
MFWRKKPAEEPQQQEIAAAASDESGMEASMPPIDQKPFMQAIWPVLACGAGLFSDGYVNNVIGSVSTTLRYEYGTVYTGSHAYGIVSAIAFAGTVVGQLVFGVLSDRWSRTGSLLVSTVILIVFTALAAGSYYHGDPVGMFNILTAWRFFVGIGIGGEYPAGSVSCAESSGELKGGTRNRWFILFTNSMIDWGFVVGAFVPYVVAAAAHNIYYGTIWRTSLGIGTVFPLILFVLRLKLKEPEEFSRNSMKNVKTPYLLVLRFYGFRLFIVSLIWFIYDFSAYAFGIYSSSILASIYGNGAPLTTVFGWNTVINLFYLPGTMLGAPVSDRLGPRYTLILGQVLQAIVGFIMAGCYAKISQPNVVAAFAVVYGIFMSLGEFGPGNNIGLLAAKTCATGIRGQYYGVAAAIGKIGAFVGVYVFPYIQAAGGSPTDTAYYQYPFYVSASLCLLAAALAFFCLPHIGQDTITLEDERFREFLESNGWDTRQLGLRKGESVDEISGVSQEEKGVSV